MNLITFINGCLRPHREQRPLTMLYPARKPLEVETNESRVFTAEEALRYVAHQGRFCRDRDTTEALCILVPVLARAMKLRPMSDAEAAAFKERLRRALQ